MKKAIGIVLLAVVLVVVLGAVYSYVTLRPALSADNIEDVEVLDECVLVTGVPGPEDFEYVSSANGLVLSGTDRRDEDATGSLYWMDLSVPTDELTVVPIDADYPNDFRPHGIAGVHSDEGGALYVISHPNKDDGEHTIEMFAVLPGDGVPNIQAVDTLSDDLLVSPNDLVVLPNGDLLVANDGINLFGGLPMLYLDVLMRSGRAPLVYYDGSQFADMEDDFISSAGITAVEEDGDLYLYRPNMWGNVHKYEVTWDDPDEDKEDDEDYVNVPQLERVETWDIESGPDNLQVGTDGDVYVAGHHSWRLLMTHEDDGDELSPTQVFRLDTDGDVELVYANEGDEISAGSVATVIDGRLIVGQLFDDGVLVCPFDK